MLPGGISPRLAAAAERAALPIKVRADFTLAGSPQWWVYSGPVKDDFCDYYTPAEATRAYLDLVSKLQSDPVASLPVTGTTAACASSSCPRGVE